jgi:hypothetical protein
VDPRTGLDAVEKRKILSPCRESHPGRPARSQALYRLNYPGPKTNRLTSTIPKILRGGGDNFKERLKHSKIVA